MYTYLSGYVYIIRYTNDTYVAGESAALLLSLIPNCRAGYNIQFCGFAWVACAAVLFWIMVSGQYNGKYSKSRNHYVLHNSPFSFHIWSQIEATMCITCVLIIPKIQFIFFTSDAPSNRNQNLTVPGRYPVSHRSWQCLFPHCLIKSYLTRPP